MRCPTRQRADPMNRGPDRVGAFSCHVPFDNATNWRHYRVRRCVRCRSKTFPPMFFVHCRAGRGCIRTVSSRLIWTNAANCTSGPPNRSALARADRSTTMCSRSGAGCSREPWRTPDTRYRRTPHGAYRVYIADCVAGRCHTQERPTSGLVRQSDDLHRVNHISQRVIGTGHSYDFPVVTFHSSRPLGFTATLMEITEFGTAPAARILFRHGAEPKYFPREPQDAHEERLVWEALDHAIR